MKLTTCLLFVVFFQASASVFSQNSARLNINVEKESIVNILQILENQTDYTFMFNKSNIDVERKIDVNIKEKGIEEVLDILFKGTNVKYRSFNKNYVLYTDDKVPDQIQTKMQQQKTVTGKVMDSTGASLPGVTVVTKGTTQGTITDVDGNFSLSGVSSDAILVFSFVGMQTEEVVVGNNTTVDITLKEQSIGIEEVVAIGYGTIQKKDITGAVSSVSGDVLTAIPVPSFEQSLSGRAAGVEVISGSGTPGAGASIRIRGVGTLNNNEPLYVIDGIILGNVSGGSQTGISPLSLINPNDIESIDILKDASATAIYGARAGNGVVIITTKRGDGDKLNISLDSYQSFQVLDQSNFTMLSGPQWASYYDELRKASGNDSYPGQAFVNRVKNGENIPQYSWLDNVLKNGISQSHNLSLSGGNKSSNYYSSLGYFKQEGLMDNSDLERYTLRANSDHQIGKLKFGNTLLISRSIANTVGNVDANSNTEDHLRRVLQENPYRPIYSESGDYAGVDSQDTDAELQLDFQGRHTIWFLDNEYRRQDRNRVWASVYADLELTEGLIFHTMGSVDFSYNKSEHHAPHNNILGNSMVSSDLNRLSISSNENRTWFIENTLTYNKQFLQDHKITAMLGYQAQNYNGTSYGVTDGEFVDNDYWFFDRPHNQTDIFNSDGSVIMSIPAFTPRLSNGQVESAFVSAFARFIYDYKGKYLLTATIRRDASSKFGSDKRWGTFPAVSAGWRISEEDFMKDLEWIHNLKLRAGYGISGSDNVPNYQFSSNVGFGEGYDYSFNEGVASGATIGRLANTFLRWEEISMKNVGLDIGLLDGRLEVNADYFDKTTSDLFLPFTPALEVGSEVNPSGNLGEVNNKGFELSLHSVNIQGKIGWTSDFSFSTVKNKIVKLPDNADRFNSVNLSRVGEEIGTIYGYVMDGLFQNWDEVYDHAYQNQAVTGFDEDNMPIYDTAKTDQATGLSFTAPGDIRFKDLNNDGFIDAENDRQIIGSTIPDFTWGLNNTFTYKGITLSVFLQGVQNVSVYNGLRINLERMNANWANARSSVLARWQGEGTSNFMPRGIIGDPNANERVSTRWVEDASYVRVKNVRLSYDFSRQLMQRIGVGNLQLYVVGTNLLTFTKYSGYDPEIGLRSGGDNETAGVDNGVYPLSRQYTMGLKVTF